MIKPNILTAREKEIIEKKIKGISLTQNESNILSKYVRPKLKEISKINPNLLLDRLEYNQKIESIENAIKEIILTNLKDLVAIIVYGSSIQHNYKDYNDLDILIITKNKGWVNVGDKYRLITKFTEIAKKKGLNLDIQLLDKKTFYDQYSSSPSLIYQLKDCKVIYGNLPLPSKKELSKLDLRMKLDWSDMDDENSTGNEIYQSFRNIILIRLILNKIVDNELLRINVNKELGENMVAKLKTNMANKLEKKLVLAYIKELSEKTDKEIKDSKWEKIKL